LQLSNDLHRPHLRSARYRPGREAGPQRVERAEFVADLALDIADDVHNMREAFDLHQPRHTHGARLRNATDIVPPEIDQHDVLGPLLLVGQQLLGQLGVVLRIGAAWTRAGDWMGGDDAFLDPHQQLRGRADDTVITDVEVEHVRAWVYRPQRPVNGEWVSRSRDVDSLGEHHLEDVAGRDVLPGCLDH